MLELSLQDLASEFVYRQMSEQTREELRMAIANRLRDWNERESLTLKYPTRVAVLMFPEWGHVEVMSADAPETEVKNMAMKLIQKGIPISIIATEMRKEFPALYPIIGHWLMRDCARQLGED